MRTATPLIGVALIGLLVPIMAACNEGRAVPHNNETTQPSDNGSTTVLILFHSTCTMLPDCSGDERYGPDVPAGMRSFFQKVSRLEGNRVRIGVIDYGADDLELVAPLGPPAALAKATYPGFESYSDSVSADLSTALADSYKRLRDLRGRKLILIVSDGQVLRDSFGYDNVPAELEPFHRASIEIHAFALSRYYSRRENHHARLRNLADIDRLVKFDVIGDGSALANKLEAILAETGATGDRPLTLD